MDYFKLAEEQDMVIEEKDTFKKEGDIILNSWVFEIRSDVILEGIKFSATAKSVSFMKLLRYYFCAVLLAVYVLLVCEFLTLFRKGVGDLGIGTLVQTENLG